MIFFDRATNIASSTTAGYNYCTAIGKGIKQSIDTANVIKLQEDYSAKLLTLLMVFLEQNVQIVDNGFTGTG